MEPCFGLQVIMDRYWQHLNALICWKPQWRRVIHPGHRRQEEVPLLHRRH